MTFKHKLSRRLALIRGLAVAAATITAAACNDNPAGVTGDGDATDLSASLTGSGIVGSRIRTSGTANIRSGPKLSAPQLGAQPGGAQGTVIAGPVVDSTGDRLKRWQVNFDYGVDGWAADVYLVRITSVSTKFVLGARVAATGTPNIRNAPAASGTLLGTQPDGVQGTVTGGPVLDAADQLIRWQVNFDAGPDGWAGEGYLVAAPVVPVVASVVLTPSVASVVVGNGVQLTAVARDAGGASISGAAMTFTSRDTTVARVSAAGLVTSIAVGTVGIIAASGGKADTTAVTVLPVPVASVVLGPATVSLAPGGTQQLTVTTKDSAGNVLTGRVVTWGTSAAAVASVSASGLVTALTAGSSTITATSEGKSGFSTATVSAPVSTRSGYYAAPTGTSGGDGSIANPWNLPTALAGGNGRVQPGDTVWLRGGTYRGAFRSTLRGTAGQPVVVRQYPGERAVIDGAGTPGTTSIFYVGGDWSTFWGFEITNSDPVRTTSSTANNVRSNVVVNYANHTKYINLVVHDGGVAFYNEPQYSDVEIAGCIVYNNGWQGPDRGHGHGLYLKSNSGPVVARDNVLFNQFGYGVHLYSNAGSGQLNNIRLEGNVAFNNGTVANNSTSSNILLGGGDRATGDVVRDNMTWFASAAAGTNVKIGYGTLMNGDVQVTGNTFVGGTPVLDVGFWSSMTLTGNLFAGSGTMVTLNDGSSSNKSWSVNTHQRDPLASAWRRTGTSYNFVAWTLASGLALSDVVLPGLPLVTKVIVRANPYEPGRAMVVVYNWGHLGSVVASLSGVLSAGDRYEVRNVQSLYGAPIASGTFSGGAVTIPMSGVAAPVPIGYSSTPAPRTGPDFDVFIVTKL